MIDAKWVYTWKTDEQGWIVARGFKQREEKYVRETFAPNVSSFCACLLSVIANEVDLDLCHFDADQACVKSHLDEDTFLRLPKGCG